MKKILFLIISLITITAVQAQIPYYSGSQGKGKTYTYFSTKFHPGTDNQQVYITAQHGILDKLDLVTDLSVGSGYSYQGFGLRFNAFNSKYFGIGGQVMSQFNLQDNYKYNYLGSSIYMNGNIWSGLHWVSNTWFTAYRHGRDTWEQWIYLGWTVRKFTPMIGLDTYLRDCKGSDLMAGCYYTVGKMNLYAWCSNITKNYGDVRVVLGFDYKF